jgi:hypothetical protein
VIARLETLACSLDGDERAARTARLARLRESASTTSDTEWRFPLDLELARELAELAALEARCCNATFGLEVGPAGIAFALRR